MTEDNHAAILREALRLGFMTCVFGGGDKPHVKVAFANLSEAHALQDALTALASAQPRPEVAGERHAALIEVKIIVETEEELGGDPPFPMSEESLRVARAVVRATKKSIAERIDKALRAPAPSSQGERVDWEARAKAFEAALRKLRDQQYQHPWTVNEAAQELARADAAEARAQAAEAEAGRLTSERDAMRSALLGVPKIAEEIRVKWVDGMRAGKLLVALIDPTLRYRDDCTAVHEAAALASQGSEAAEQGEHAR